MIQKVLLFINGNPPEKLPDFSDYALIACTDGAFHYLKRIGFPLDKLDFVAGDFDSHSGEDSDFYQHRFIHTPDQEKTDFEKILELISEKGYSKIDIYGGSGREMDHFLGNLTVAYKFKKKLDLIFFDEYSHYFFIPNKFKINNVDGKMISLFPFPSVENLSTKGLNWEISNENLDMRTEMATRNFAVNNEVEMHFEKGDVLLFIGEKYL